MTRDRVERTAGRGPIGGVPANRPSLVFVVAYQAEATSVQMLEPTPRSVLRDRDREILVVDDAFADRTLGTPPFAPGVR